MLDEDIEELRRKIETIKTEHRDLDDVISRMGEDGVIDQLRLQRLKKRKLALKDEVARLENMLVPDIIA